MEEEEVRREERNTQQALNVCYSCVIVRCKRERREEGGERREEGGGGGGGGRRKEYVVYMYAYLLVNVVSTNKETKENKEEVADNVSCACGAWTGRGRNMVGVSSLLPCCCHVAACLRWWCSCVRMPCALTHVLQICTTLVPDFPPRTLNCIY